MTIRHKINEFTNEVACGQNPDLAICADKWEFTTCKSCINRKGKISYHPHHRGREGRKRIKHRLYGMNIKTYMKGRDKKVERSLFKKFKIKQPKKFPFGDTLRMPKQCY